MANDINSTDPGITAGASAAIALEREPGAPFVAHPGEILDDLALSTEQKREILASWLSDRHAVPDAPRWRQLDNGAFVDSEDIMRALYALDDAEESKRRNGSSLASSSARRRREQPQRRISALFSRKRDDDDDDPPPSPAAIRLPVPDNPNPQPASMPGLMLAA